MEDGNHYLFCMSLSNWKILLNKSQYDNYGQMESWLFLFRRQEFWIQIITEIGPFEQDRLTNIFNLMNTRQGKLLSNAMPLTFMVSKTTTKRVAYKRSIRLLGKYHKLRKCQFDIWKWIRFNLPVIVISTLS